MTDYIYTFAAIASANDYEAINTLAEALGHGPGTLSVPLSANGIAPATHYGTATYVRQDFLDTLGSGLQGQVPPSLEGQYTGAEVQAILSGLTYSVTADSAKDALESLISANGLQRVQEEGP